MWLHNLLIASLLLFTRLRASSLVRFAHRFQFRSEDPSLFLFFSHKDGGILWLLRDNASARGPRNSVSLMPPTRDLSLSISSREKKPMCVKTRWTRKENTRAREHIYRILYYVQKPPAMTICAQTFQADKAIIKPRARARCGATVIIRLYLHHGWRCSLHNLRFRAILIRNDQYWY